MTFEKDRPMGSTHELACHFIATYWLNGNNEISPRKPKLRSNSPLARVSSDWEYSREWVDTYIESGLIIEKLAGDSVDYRFGARSRVFSGIDLEFIYHSTRSPGYRKNDWMAIQVHAFH